MHSCLPVHRSMNERVCANNTAQVSKPKEYVRLGLGLCLALYLSILVQLKNRCLLPPFFLIGHYLQDNFVHEYQKKSH